MTKERQVLSLARDSVGAADCAFIGGPEPGSFRAGRRIAPSGENDMRILGVFALDEKNVPLTRRAPRAHWQKTLTVFVVVVSASGTSIAQGHDRDRDRDDAFLPSPVRVVSTVPA